jgi:hypothetical protein
MIPRSLIRLAIQQRFCRDWKAISHAETGKKWRIFPHRCFNHKQANAYHKYTALHTKIHSYVYVLIRAIWMQMLLQPSLVQFGHILFIQKRYVLATFKTLLVTLSGKTTEAYFFTNFLQLSITVCVQYIRQLSNCQLV